MATSTTQRTGSKMRDNQRFGGDTGLLDPANRRDAGASLEFPASPQSYAATSPTTVRFVEPTIDEQHFELPMSLDEVRKMHADRWAFFAFRRLLDIGTALAVLTFALPVMAVIAVAVRLDSNGPSLFGHWRLGREGKQFRCWKFRTMHTDADVRLQELLATNSEFREEWLRDQKAKDDPRVTGLGSFLRRTSLDELPQLFNVLIGQMSILGPRPITQDERLRYGNAMPLVHTVRPGMTGIWQVTAERHAAYSDRVRLDIEAICSMSMSNDLLTLARTAQYCLRELASTATSKLGER